MNTKRIFAFIVTTFFLISGTIAQINEIEILKRKLVHDALINHGFAPRIERYITPEFNRAIEYLESINPNGSWPDVNYGDRDNNWAPLMHLNRVIVMTVNHEKEHTVLFQNAALLDGIERAINYWYTVNPECDNWYKNIIAKQFYFNVIALLTEGKINASLHAKMLNDLTEKPTRTGSNRTLLATSTFYKGVLTNNPEMIESGVTGVTDQILVTTEEGIQPDYSFHQHGHFIYNGNYGFNFLRESIWLATIVHGSAFAYSDEHIKILRDYYLEGTRWMIRGGLIDYNVRGRQVGRHDGLKLYADLLIPILEQMMIADPDYAEHYQTSIDKIKDNQPQNTIGHKHFWRSDYTIHHREIYSTSLKMCSERTVGIELNMNSENKLGYWLPYGLTYMYRKGDEYHGLFPTWDWARLPGVTNPYIEIEEKGNGVAHSQSTDFVGGVSNGKNGISAMDFSKNHTRARKAWFWFDEEWVALGAGISSDHHKPIVTGVNQCLQKGEVIVDGEKNLKRRETLSNPTWILHDSIAYIFPGKEDIEYSNGIQKGNIQRIYGLGKDSVYSSRVFSLWFDHGKNPKDESYEHVVVPGIGEKEIRSYVKHPPISIIQNTKQIQAVSQTELQLTGIVFYEKGTIQKDQLLIAVDRPCLVLLNEKNNIITISDPTSNLQEVKISIRKNERIVFNQSVKLPKDELAGQSVSYEIFTKK